MNDFDDRARRAADHLRGEAAEISETEAALARLKNAAMSEDESSAHHATRQRLLVAASIVGALSLGIAALVWRAGDNTTSVVSQTVELPSTSTDNAPDTTAQVSRTTILPTTTQPPDDPVATPAGFDVMVPADGADSAPIVHLATIPWGTGDGQIGLQNAEFGLWVALFPESIIALEENPGTGRFTGKGIRVERSTGTVLGDVILDGIDLGTVLGAVGSPTDHLLVQTLLGDEPTDGFATFALAEQEVGRFAVVGQTEPSGELGDGAFRPSPVTVNDDGSLGFADAPTPAAPIATVDGLGGVERTDGDTVTKWRVSVEENGASLLRAEAFLDGALFVTEKYPFSALIQDIAYLDPARERTVTWRLRDGWRLVDHDIADALVARGTSDGLEIGMLDTSSLIDDPATEPASPDNCGVTDPAPSGLMFDIVSCVQRDEISTALVAQRAIDGTRADATRWFTTASSFSPGVDLDGPRPIEGLGGDALSFVADLDDVRCSVIVSGRGEWREHCWSTIADVPWTPPAFTLLDGELVQLDVSDPLVVGAVVLDDSVWKSSGCSYEDALALTTLALERGPSGSIFTSMGCTADIAAVRAGGVFLQPGSPDGGIFLFERAADGWQLVDVGTGIEDAPLFDVPTPDTWMAWPGDTNPRPVFRDLDDVNSLATFDRLAGSEAVADAVTGLLLDEAQRDGIGTTVETIHVDPGLVVLEETGIGDDAASGVVHFIHTLGIGDGYVITDWFYSSICSRGGGPAGCL